MKYSYDEKCLDLARHFFPTQSIAFLEALAQEFQDCVEGREDDADVRTLPIPDFLRNQENLRAERAELETRTGQCTDPAGGACKTCGARPGIPCPMSSLKTRPVPDDRWIKHEQDTSARCPHGKPVDDTEHQCRRCGPVVSG